MGKLEDQMNRTQLERGLSVSLAKIRGALREHWLTGIHCDHEAKTDKASCYCAIWASAPLPNVGSAVEAWIDHFISTLQQ
jgi:hypothetical protein